MQLPSRWRVLIPYERISRRIIVWNPPPAPAASRCARPRPICGLPFAKSIPAWP